MNWLHDRVRTGELTFTEREWEDVYTVLDYTPTNPVWYGLLLDQPSLTPGTAHPTVVGAVVDTFEAERIGNTKAFKVTVKWKLSLESEDDTDYTTPPHLRPAKITMQTERAEVDAYTSYTSVSDYSYSDTPQIITNRLGEMIVGLTRPVTIVNYNVTKNVLMLPADIDQYCNKINLSPIIVKGRVCAQDTVLFRDLSVSEIQYETIAEVTYSYMVWSFTLSYKADTWKEQYFNRGLYCKDSTRYDNQPGDIGPCMIGDQEATEPQFIDSTGHQIGLEETPAAKWGQISSASFYVWPYKRMNMSALPTSEV